MSLDGTNARPSSRSCIKGHRSSTCNHIGGPLWAVRPAGRPNKACIHGPSDLCLCAHYFPLTWLKAAVPRNKKCSCQRPGSGSKKCCCGGGNNAAASAADDDTQPIFYQDLVARGLHVTTEPVDIDVAPAAPPPPPSSCCSVPAAAPTPVASSCCSAPRSSVSSMNTPVQMPVPLQPPAPAQAPSSCCGGGANKTENVTPAPPVTNGHHIKTEPITSSAPFTPIQQFQSLPDFPVMKFSPTSNNGTAADHVCECGPTCNCVLCIDHPYNTATMNHIATEFGQMMSDGAQFSPPSSSTNRHGSSDFFSQNWATNGMFPPGFGDPTMMSRIYSQAQQQHQQQQQQQQRQQPQQSYSPPPHASDMDIILNPADFQMFNFAFPPTEDGTDFDSGLDMGSGDMHGDMHHHGGSSDMDAMQNLMDLNGFCGGAPEGCPCGDDCACIGCQIHKPTNGLGIGVGPSTWG